MRPKDTGRRGTVRGAGEAAALPAWARALLLLLLTAPALALLGG